MKEALYLCKKCGHHFYASDVETRKDIETGFVDLYCPQCGACDEIYDAAHCDVCDRYFFEDENIVYDNWCLECLSDWFSYDAAFRHIRKCRECCYEFTLLLNKMEQTVNKPSDRMAAITISYAEIIRNRAQSVPEWNKSEFAKDIEKCIYKTCLGECADIDHYVNNVDFRTPWDDRRQKQKGVENERIRN